jgi:hypothetical protein
MPFRTVLPSTTRVLSRPGRRNPPMRKPTGVKIWMRSLLFGASATTKVPFGSTANAVGIDDPSLLAADVDDLPRARLLRIEPVNDVRRRSKTKYCPEADC